MSESCLRRVPRAWWNERTGASGTVPLLQNRMHPFNVAAETFLHRIRLDSAGLRSRPRILVVGGGSVGNGGEDFYRDETVDIYAFDIYASASTQAIADAARDSVGRLVLRDGVVIQAVLEHVLTPDRVVSEIHRVLVPGGYVYAETPFMQQVHEGPWDFTRYTESGHRWLFRRFSCEESGANAGPGTSALWAFDYLVRALSGRRIAGSVARLSMWWLAVLDRFIKPGRELDGANGVFFYGRKSDDELRPSDIIAHYERVRAVARSF